MPALTSPSTGLTVTGRSVTGRSADPAAFQDPRPAPVLAAMALAALALAGCLGGGPGAAGPAAPASEAYLHLDELALSEVRFDALPPEEVWIPASTDGQQMHAVVWRPDVTAGPAADPDWKAPVILIDTPYRVSISRSDATDPAEPMGSDAYDWLITELVPRGYAVVYKEVRGTGESGGCLEQTASTQRQDGYDAVEWLAAQGWSNGRVGMFGKSYLAETQYGAAVLQPPSLVTIVPVASVSGQYEWNYYDGVPFTLHTLTGNAVYLGTSGAPPGTTPQGLLNYPSHYECQVFMMQEGADVSGDWSDYWADRELRTWFGDIEASVLYVHGLQDWNVRQVAVRDSFEKIPSEKRLVLGQWRHDFPDSNNFVGEWSRTDWRTTVHAWYDHYLLGLDNGILERLPDVQVQDSLGQWRAEASFPPTDAVPATFHLSPAGLVRDAPEPFAMQLRENEEAFLRSQGLTFVPDADTPQATELAFTSAPLESDLHFSGWPVLEFDLELFDGLTPDPDTEIDAHFAANLHIADCDRAGWINAGYLSARHRDGVDAPAPVPEEQVITYTLRFHPADTVVPAGCSLHLVFAGSDDATQPEGTFWGAELSRGTLTFPSVDRDLDRVGLDVPYRE